MFDGVDFEDVLIEKGFELESKGLETLKFDKGTKMYAFVKKGYNEFAVTKIVNGNVNLMTTFMSTEVEDYQFLKKQVTDNGFKFINTEAELNQHIYQNEDGIEVSLITQYSTDLRKNAYLINIMDKTNKEYITRQFKK